MESGGSLAIVLSVVALAVSMLAAGFTGWQALTAHLERTRPRPASFTLTEPERSLGGPSGLVLTNTGGSIATNIRVAIPFTLPKGREPLVGTATGPLAPGNSTQLEGTKNKALPRGRYLPNPDKPGTWIPAAAVSGEGVFALEKHALVEWRDFRGRKRVGRIGLR